MSIWNATVCLLRLCSGKWFATGYQAVTNSKIKRDVRAFLSITGYYRKFIADYATVAAPLTDLTKKKSPNQVIWTERCAQAWKTLKDILCSSPVLKSPDFSSQFILQTDASDHGA